MDALKFLSFNCRGLGGQEKRRDVLDYLRNLKYDLYFLQDTHLTKRKESAFNTVWGGKGYHAFGTLNSRGTSILFSTRLQYEVKYEEYCPDGNYCILICTIFANTYTLINIYGPNEDQPVFFDRINQRLNELSNDNVIIGGDFNFVLNVQRDSNYLRQNNPRAKNVFVKTIEEHGLIDAWIELNPNKRAFTWHKQNPHKFGRLDMFLISDHLRNIVASSSMLAGYRSDHSMITLHISTLQKRRGPGLWKFNDSLIADDSYDKIVKDLIVNVIAQYAIPVYSENYMSDPVNFESIQFTINDSLFYETLLMLIRGETVKYSKLRARKYREKETELCKEIMLIRKSLNDYPNPENLKRLEDKQKVLEELRKPKIQGLITRCRVNWHEEGETCSKYFLSLEKRNSTRKAINALETNDGVITDKEMILEYFSDNLRNKYLQ